MKVIIVVSFASLFAPARGADVPPLQYFPLDPGRKWAYGPEGNPAGERFVSVLDVVDDAYLVDIFGTEVLIGGPPDAPDIELPGEGFVPYYRFQEKTFLHRDIQVCDDRRTIAAAGYETVETPAGTFADCLRLDYGQWVCADAGKISEWWAPGVGLVRWTEQSFTGPRSWILTKVIPSPGGGPFLRGDANADGIIVIADPVYILNDLFASGPAPPCLDAADTNDDGVLDLGDPIFLLNYLFASGPVPPPPGPDVPGYDETPDDPFTCGDPIPPACRTAQASTLPGVRFDLTGNACAISLADAAEGATFLYRTIIESDIAGTIAESLDGGGCDAPDRSGLAVLETIEGEGQSYCLCDVGHCVPLVNAVDLVAGTYEGEFDWDGRNWNGPSDTNNPEGPPFPAGRYRFTVRAAGTYPGGSGERIPYEVSAWTEFVLVP
ncbi:MAG: hypothetical protein JXP34_22560 [Planctomycetes bacterium]|nr:hypothetical protein [Planctomycetota bacterium]